MSVEPSDREPVLREYLLGGLAPAEREEIEEKLLTDADFHAELQATGDDLIHVYLADELPAPDRERFESHFLASPRRRERVAFVRSLVSAVDRVRHDASRPTGTHAVPSAPRRSLSVLLPWAAALVMGLGAGGWSVHERRMREQERAQANERETSLREELTTSEARRQELEQVAGAVTRTEDIETWPLPPDTERGAGATRAFNVGKVTSVRLRMPLDHPLGVGDCWAVLLTANGDEIFRTGPWPAPGPKARTFDVIVPGRLLTAGQYILSLQRVGKVPPDQVELDATPFVVR